MNVVLTRHARGDPLCSHTVDQWVGVGVRAIGRDLSIDKCCGGDRCVVVTRGWCWGRRVAGEYRGGDGGQAGISRMNVVVA